MSNTENLPDVYQMADFETPVPTEVVPAMVWSVQKYKVAQMIALQGKTRKQISEETKVPLWTIDKWANHVDFKAYVKSLIEQAAATMKQENISLLSKVIAARVEQAEKTGDYASLSRKDTLEIIKELNTMTEDETKREESQYSRLLEKLVLNSLPKNQVLGGDA